MRKKLLEIDVRKVHPNLAGFMAFVNTYNKSKENLGGDAPTLEINWTRPDHDWMGPVNGGKNEPALRRAKNSYVVNIDPENPKIDLSEAGHDIIHLLTVNIAKHFAPKQGQNDHKNNKMFFSAKEINNRIDNQDRMFISSVLNSPFKGIRSEQEYTALIKALYAARNIEPIDAHGTWTEKAAAIQKLISKFTDRRSRVGEKNYFTATAKTPMEFRARTDRPDGDLKQHSREEDDGNKMLDSIFQTPIQRSIPVNVAIFQESFPLAQKYPWLEKFCLMFNQELERMKSIKRESIKDWFKI